MRPFNADTIRPVEQSEEAAVRLAKLFSRADVQLRDILAIVSTDEALVARLLRVANSAARPTLMPVKTVKDAIIRLGNAAVLRLADESGSALSRAREREIASRAA